jgi:eukaryotic-like serine/threonine-protein kinase
VTDPLRRRRVEEVCDAALDRAPDQRAAFVAAACGDDAELRQAVEALLAHADAADAFLRVPVADVAAYVLGDTRSAARVGAHIGSHKILSFLGAGGMGEVYRAHDVKLGRDVAIKVLPNTFVSDPVRRARFEREARVLATLNHPNIGAIYGLEHAEGIPALVLELVDGPTLADRIASGPIPLAEALPIALQIAHALEAAHERGIIHRDLKPGNVKLRPDGTVKVLDFGLAKAIDPPVGSVDGKLSDTAAAPLATESRVIAGTPAYMSPEQASGKPLDERTDIWAFGCVLYEMLTGTPAFKAGDVAETLVRVLREDVDWSLLPQELSPITGAFLRRCLTKNPRQRVSSIADLRLALEGAFEPQSVRATPAGAKSWPARGRLLALAATIVVAAVIVFAVWNSRDRVAVPGVTRLEMPLPAGQDFYFNGRNIVAISPSGNQVAFTAGPGLWLRSLDQLEARQIAGTELEGRSPFFSPDGQSLGYYAAGELRRVALTGGAPVTLAKIVNPWGATWGEDGTILYGQGPQGIWRVPATGGTPERVIAVAKGEVAFGPQLLPGGEWILFTLRPRGVGSWNRAQIVVQKIGTDERTILIDGGRDARFIPTGHLIYGLHGVLLAVPFNAPARRVTGNAVPLIRNVYDAGTITGAVHYGVAANGSMAYVPRIDTSLRMSWVDRNGHEQEIPVEPRAYRHARISPDGTRIAVEIEDDNSTDVWVGDSVRGMFTRLTREDDVASDPIWTRDGSRVVFSAVRQSDGLFVQAADGSGAAEHLVDGSGGVRAMASTTDGHLAYEELAGTDVRVVRLNEPAAAERIPLFDAPEYFYERLPALSPDGRWVAYQSIESGRMEVYVRPFPNVRSARWQISSGGGFAPLWSPDGSEIFYRNASSMMGVQIQTNPMFRLVASRPLFNLAGYVLAGQRGIRYDVGPDGRFLLLKNNVPATDSIRKIVVVQNWFEELRRLVSPR